MGMREAYMEERAKKLVTVIAMTLAIVALLGQVLVDVVRRQRSREVCVAVLYENYIRCDNGVDHYRQTVRIESPTKPVSSIPLFDSRSRFHQCIRQSRPCRDTFSTR